MLSLKVTDEYMSAADVERARAAALRAQYPVKEQGGVEWHGVHVVEETDAHLTIYRKYLPAFKHPTFIHDDLGLGKKTRIVFLHRGDGHSLRFYRAKVARPDTFRLNDWEVIASVEAKFNRAVEFNSEVPHSRWPKDDPTANDRTARLVQVTFTK